MIRFLTVLFVMFFAAVSASAQIKIEQVTSEGGIQAWLVNESAIPFVAIQIAFQGGTALDAEGKTGATNFMVGLLEEGTGNMDATAFRQASESLAAKFGFSANRDSVRISVQVLKANMKLA